ncbi:MAG: AAA domain-containing protein [Gammaproteobacteria bacterium]|nr:AAA domain-containing protein [Gammaproteobacteria bacterium]
MDTVLVIDADQDRLQVLRTVLNFVNYSVLAARDDADWAAISGKLDTITAVMLPEHLDHRLQELYSRVRNADPGLPVIQVTEERSEETDELESHGHIQIVLPVSYEELIAALRQASLRRGGQQQGRGRQSPELFRSLVGNSTVIRQVRTMIEQVADSDATVLILGESGTGKEVVARNIHYHSARRGRPFVPINCGAIPGELLESELFGHEKGAFTGAISARQGRFEMAEGGTLFLDEIGDMSMPMQVKLLRVLQERTFERVGSNKTIVANVRIIAATHQNLEKAIGEGKFREDLFYRLNVFPIDTPALRDRAEDVPLLLKELITRLEHEGRGSVRLSQDAVMALCQYNWPGNVRELANVVERLMIMHPYGVVTARDLPPKFRVDDIEEAYAPPLAAAAAGIMPEVPNGEVMSAFDSPRLPRDGIDLKQHLSDLEYNLIKQALDEADGVVAHAASRLRLRRTTLVEKLRKYGLQRPDEVTKV